VVGVPRSGTTLLRMMLDAHSELSIPPETEFIRAVLELRPPRPDGREAFVRTLTSARTWDDMDLPAAELRRAVEAIDPFDLGAGLRCFYRLYARRRGKPRWGDKTPSYGRHADRVERLLPEARFVHVIRDGRDVALSLRGRWFSPGDDIEDLARHWRRSVTGTRRAGRACAHYTEVRFESLVRRPSEELATIAEFVELPFERGMERYAELSAARHAELKPRPATPGLVAISREQRLDLHRLTMAPPQPSRIGRWRQEMGAEERARFERVAGDLLEELGYETGPRRRRLTPRSWRMA
jgi:hypothetical protein